MGEMLLDTTLFKDYMRGDAGARAVVERIVTGSTAASVSPLTVFELWGSLGLDRRAELGLVGILSFLEQASLSHDAAKVAGLWLASVDEGDRVGLTRFALLAATAQERGEAICTREPELFNKFYSEVVGY